MRRLIQLTRPHRADLREDVNAAVVLGIESVPDGLATGLLAGVSPVAGLYAYMFGVTSAAFFTSSAFMAVQGTGAMAIIISDAGIGEGADPTGTLVTLSILTGVVMIGCGLLSLSRLLRYIATSVMTGFIAAVGVNIVLGQLGDFTGYTATGANRLLRAVDTLLHPWKYEIWTLFVGLLTIALILILRATRLRSLGLVAAIVLGSGAAAFIRRFDRSVAVVGDLTDVPNAIPLPALPDLDGFLTLIFPAFSLAFVGLVQGAAVSSAFINPDGRHGDANADFVGAGAGNLVAGLFQGMPVGGSMSASSLATGAGAKSRWALIYTGLVMTAVILLLADVVALIAMPALAGLLIVVGLETVKPHDILSVYKTGAVQLTSMAVTFGLTIVISLQYAVVIGVGMSILLHVVRQSNQLDTRQLVLNDDHSIDETDPPTVLAPGAVVILQPYGSLFFGAAPSLAEQLPAVVSDSRGSVVILRLRGRPDVGLTLIDVLASYSRELAAAGSKFLIVTDSERIIEQLQRTQASAAIDPENIYHGTTRLFATLSRANDDAIAWVREQKTGTS